jgi:hypothetical protein
MYAFFAILVCQNLNCLPFTKNGQDLQHGRIGFDSNPGEREIYFKFLLLSNLKGIN